MGESMGLEFAEQEARCCWLHCWSSLSGSSPAAGRGEDKAAGSMEYVLRLNVLLTADLCHHPVQVQDGIKGALPLYRAPSMPCA